MSWLLYIHLWCIFYFVICGYKNHNNIFFKNVFVYRFFYISILYQEKIKNIMEAYYCKCCKYHTVLLFNYKVHLASKKHIENSKGEKTNENTKHKKTKIFCCEQCDKTYMSGRSLQNHIDANHAISEVDTLKKTIEELNARMDNVIEIAKSNAKSTETSMNILRYAKINLNDAEPFEELKGNDIYEVMNYKNPKNIESINEEYVKIAIYKYNHGIFHTFIGDMIIEHYKPTSKKDVNLISTDTSRLSLIIMQKIT